nr:unnamed protein product [Spirometra erinaceieuropaei]
MLYNAVECQRVKVNNTEGDLQPGWWNPPASEKCHLQLPDAFGQLRCHQMSSCEHFRELSSWDSAVAKRMRLPKVACTIRLITLLTVCFLWLRNFTWELNPRRSHAETVTFHSPSTIELGTSNIHALLRQARLSVNELWRLNNAYFPARSRTSPSAGRLNSLLSQATLQLTAILALLDKVSGWREGRRQKVDAQSSHLRRHITRLQNPPDCRRSRFALAELRYSCGFGCAAHHMALKFSFAFATNRNLLLQYNDLKDFFLPLSNCSLKHAEGQPGVPRLENGLPHTGKRYYAPAMPRQWSEHLREPLGDPFPWYRGHLLGYIFRPRDPSLRHELEVELKNMRKCSHGEPYDGPMASIHVRRTDKLLSEAKFHSVDEYMLHVEHFFDLKEV